MKQVLSQIFSLNRRYSRSINLERDFSLIDVLSGYVLTDRSMDTLKRIIAAITDTESSCAWTLTGIYGTGKSAFAHYLVSLFASEENPLRRSALTICRDTFGASDPTFKIIKKSIPKQGFVRAVVTAQREPINLTILRALRRGVESFWIETGHQVPRSLSDLVRLRYDNLLGRMTDAHHILNLTKDIIRLSGTSLLFIVDEIGKNLEYAAQNQGAEDLYLLQQLSELGRENSQRVYLLGLLHQSFSDYGYTLTANQRNEWTKIQGRFEDIPFTESPGQMTRLIGQVINKKRASNLESTITRNAKSWNECLHKVAHTEGLSAETLAAAYPIHPIVALVLPRLFIKYAQNDRSLFTFLTSSEPYSFRSFLQDTSYSIGSLTTLKLYHVYDYFIATIGMSMASRPNLQRWVEVQSLIDDANHLDSDSLQVLKTIGILNLATSTGLLRATRKLVTLAMCEESTDGSAQRYWERVINRLLKRGLVHYRKQLDELRIWEGSDFDVEQEIRVYVAKDQSPLSSLLSELCPPKPQVAQRHSYKTGTLRYFEGQYLESSMNLSALRCSKDQTDGMIGYWTDHIPPECVPLQTADGKPFILLQASELGLLRAIAREFAALIKIEAYAPQLQSDGVARREVRYRLFQARRLLDDAIEQTFGLTKKHVTCWISGARVKVRSPADFNARLSRLCDEIYNKTPILWNELINRRELTSQGAKARRELITAMLERQQEERLGLIGNGPEVSMYISLLNNTGIHRYENGAWEFNTPHTPNFLPVWNTIENFLLNANDKPQSIDSLYKLLQFPPYGLKAGIIPILLAAILTNHLDDINVYKEGVFTPILGAEHFELLVKDPSRFAVKHYELTGLKAEVFKELENILQRPKPQSAAKLRNSTLLGVVRPLLLFAKKLPAYTAKTKRLSQEAKSVLQALLESQEPDELLFVSLPRACGLNPINANNDNDISAAVAFRRKLVQFLHEIQSAYDHLLEECQALLYDAFGVRSSQINLREDLRVRGNYLVGQCIEPTLRRFILAATDETVTDKEWVEAILMILGDKPAESWNDEDILAFEIKLSDIARRFKNLEALQKDVSSRNKHGFEARRITITKPDGQEIHRMIWIDGESQEKLEALALSILETGALRNNIRLQEALVTRLAEFILGANDQNSIAVVGSRDRSVDYDKEESPAYSRTLRRKR